MSITMNEQGVVMNVEALRKTRKVEAKLCSDPHKINPVAPYQAVPFSGAIKKYTAKSIPVQEPDSSLSEEVKGNCLCCPGVRHGVYVYLRMCCCTGEEGKH